MNELLRKKKIISQIIENHDLNDEEFEVMIDVLEIVNEKIINLLKRKKGL